MSAQALPVRTLWREAPRGTVKEGVTGGEGVPVKRVLAGKGCGSGSSSELPGASELRGLLIRLAASRHPRLPGHSGPPLHPPLREGDAASPRAPRDRKWRHL